MERSGHGLDPCASVEGFRGDCAKIWSAIVLRLRLNTGTSTLLFKDQS